MFTFLASHRNKKSKKELLIDKYLKRVYYNEGSAGGFGGLSKLWAHVKTREDAPTGMTHATVKKWLREQDTWSVFKSRNHKFKREKIIAGSMLIHMLYSLFYAECSKKTLA